MSAGVPAVVFYSLTTHRPLSVTLYGIGYVTNHFDLLAALLLLGVLGAGSAAYGLLWGRSWGLDVGLIVGAFGLALSIWSLFLNTAGYTHIPLEPFLLVPFMVALKRRRRAWNEAAGD